jgi:hypothetical protein
MKTKTLVGKASVGIAMVMMLLAGCGEPPKELGKFVNVKVVNTEKIEHCSRGCWNEYKVTLNKDGTTVKLGVDDENMYNLLQKGNVVNITYNEDYKITKLTFPTMEK